MLKVADGRSVQSVVAQPPLLDKSLSKVNYSLWVQDKMRANDIGFKILRIARYESETCF
jgi:hypothetical protein